LDDDREWAMSFMLLPKLTDEFVSVVGVGGTDPRSGIDLLQAAPAQFSQELDEASFTLPGGQ